MTNPDKASRQDKVLEYIITAYVEIGAPVGSVTLRDRSNLGLSPATIRNVMSELEGLGLITQPHTSAGRVPTDAGYRYYLDRIMEPDTITENEKDTICSLCDSAGYELDILLEDVSRLLSDISNEASMVLLPNARLVSFGWHHLFGQPEFKDASGPSRLLRAFEEKKELLGFVQYTGSRLRVEESVNAQEARVFVGSENTCRDISDCSVVISGYGQNERIRGAIGVIGPTRMLYKRVVPIVNFVAKQIGSVLEETE